MNHQAMNADLSSIHYLVGETLCWAYDPDSGVMVLSCGKHAISEKDWQPALGSLESWLTELDCNKLIITTEGAMPTREQFVAMRDRFSGIKMRKFACLDTTNLSSMDATLARFASILANAFNQETVFHNVKSVNEALEKLSVPMAFHDMTARLVEKARSNHVAQ